VSDGPVSAYCSLTMMKMNSKYWNVSEFEVTYTNQTTGGEVTTKLNPKFLAPTPFNFSYHCYDVAPVWAVNATTHDIAIKFIDLQVSCFAACN